MHAAVNEAPALHFPGTQGDHGQGHAVDGREPTARVPVLYRLAVVEGAYFLHAPLSVERDLLKQQDPLLGLSDLRYITQAAFDDERAGHAAGHLEGDRAVAVRVIPESPRHVVPGNLDLVF